MAELTLGMADDGHTVEVVRRDVVVIEIPENPTTGYRWSLRSNGDPVLLLRDDTFRHAGPARPGAGGERRLEFTASAQGEAKIVLWNWREWEGQDSIRQRYSVTVTVR